MTFGTTGAVARPGWNVRQKAGPNRATSNAGWHRFAMILTDEVEEPGGRRHRARAVHVADPRGVPRRRCEEPREPSAFTCIKCGHMDHAGTNAAVDIEPRWSTPFVTQTKPSAHGPKALLEPASKAARIPIWRLAESCSYPCAAGHNLARVT